VTWYEKHLRQGDRFGTDFGPFRLFPELYARLDPGECLAAFDPADALKGLCFVHPRPTHISVGIVATAPEASGLGIARSLMQSVVERASRESKPLRLVSSLLNIDSFSLYSRLGFVPHTIYQDILFTVPAQGISCSPPAGARHIRAARKSDLSAVVELEFELQRIRRMQDYHFLFESHVGIWKVWISEEPSGTINGVLVSSEHPDWSMLGPGVARNPDIAAGLLWRALDSRRAQSSVVLVPSAESELVRTLYQWGGRNIELHVAQSLPATNHGQGIAFPTFLPESA
jgi:GNAT superfamily N-acetyltransferase